MVNIYPVVFVADVTGRNELIAKYIFQKTGQLRTRKQVHYHLANIFKIKVSSHIQVMLKKLRKEKVRTVFGSSSTSFQLPLDTTTQINEIFSSCYTHTSSLSCSSTSINSSSRRDGSGFFIQATTVMDHCDEELARERATSTKGKSTDSRQSIYE